MKKFIAFAILITLLACGNNDPLATVSELNTEDYTGKWYEIQRFPHSFEEDLQCVTAEYTLNKNGEITVINTGFKDGEMDRIEGKAWIPNPEFPGQLKVQFFWPISAPYYIIDTQPNVYSLVGSPSRKYLWILSREKTLEQNIIDDLKKKAQDLGFDTSKLEVVVQDCE